MTSIYDQCVAALRQQLQDDVSIPKDKDGNVTTITLGKRSSNMDEMLGSGRTKNA